VEEALLDPDRTKAFAYNVGAERRRALIGSTVAGRIMFVVFTHRDDIPRVVTARKATASEKRRYKKRGK